MVNYDWSTAPDWATHAYTDCWGRKFFTNAEMQISNCLWVVKDDAFTDFKAMFFGKKSKLKKVDWKKTEQIR